MTQSSEHSPIFAQNTKKLPSTPNTVQNTKKGYRNYRKLLNLKFFAIHIVCSIKRLRNAWNYQNVKILMFEGDWDEVWAKICFSDND